VLTISKELEESFELFTEHRWISFRMAWQSIHCIAVFPLDPIGSVLGLEGRRVQYVMRICFLYLLEYLVPGRLLCQQRPISGQETSCADNPGVHPFETCTPCGGATHEIQQGKNRKAHKILRRHYRSTLSM
jgi:hypothetical protein